MKTVYKYPLGPLHVANVQEITIPGDREIRHVAMQRGLVTLWVEVDPQSTPTPLVVYVLGTGHPIPEGLDYLGSVFDGPFVWHVYADKVATPRQ